jgi:hypothetical protein
MSFRLFVYYCALCGGAGAFLGWVAGRVLADVSFPGATNEVLVQGVKGLCLGLGVALALGLVDALWNYALRRVFAIGARVGVAVAIGSMGGLLGALVSQALHGKASWPLLQNFILVAGWTFIGLLVGASLGVFDLLAGLVSGKDPRGAQRKVLNGVIGGTVGGLVGGVLSVLLHGAWESQFPRELATRLWSPSATGFVALGMCIGLLIGLAQVIFKEAWLRVEAGFRAGRELILTKPEVTIGRAESCDVGLFGDMLVEKLHARIHRQGNDYVLTDEASSHGTFVNDRPVQGPHTLRSGDLIRVGRCILRFGERQKRESP